MEISRVCGEGMGMSGVRFNGNGWVKGWVVVSTTLVGGGSGVGRGF